MTVKWKWFILFCENVKFENTHLNQNEYERS